MVEVVSDSFTYPLLMVDSRPSGETAYRLVHPYTRQVI